MKFHPIALYGSNGHQIENKLKAIPGRRSPPTPGSAP